MRLLSALFTVCPYVVACREPWVAWAVNSVVCALHAPLRCYLHAMPVLLCVQDSASCWETVALSSYTQAATGNNS